MAQARQREVEEDRPSKGGGEVVMVGGMDNLTGNANEPVEIELEDDKSQDKRVVADIEDSDDDKQARLKEVEEDARLAYDDSERGTEERQSRRKRRNNARREAINGRDAEIAGLYQRIDHLTGIIQGVTKGQASLTMNTLESQLGAAQQALQMADEELARAVANSDGEKFREIQRLRDEASARVFQLSNARQRMAYEAQAGGQVPQRPQPQGQAQATVSPKATDYTETFMSRFSYFDPNGTDEESMMIRAIDDSVAAEGYRPDTPLYWRTLEERLAKRGFLPDKGGDSDDGDDTPEPRRVARTTGMPPTSSGRNTRRTSGTTFALDPMMREYLEGEGLLDQNLAPDQKQRRDRLIQQWRNNQQRAKRGEYSRS
ncbi:MAG: hypothetical protein RLZZ393_576 [Pseudomonadota bacterium]|jgi:hypothetical protein